MKLVAVFLFAILVQPLAAEGHGGEFQELGETLAFALSNGDIVEFSHCWSTTRGARSQIAELRKRGEDIPQAEVDAAFKDTTERNAALAKSFSLIQQALTEADVEPKSIKLKMVSARGRRKDGEQERVGEFVLTFSSSKGEIELQLDDGGKTDGRWFVLDLPVALKIGGKSYPTK